MENILQYNGDGLNSSQRKFIAHTIKQANKNNFSVHLINSRYVILHDGIKVNGYVDEGTRILAVACRQQTDRWFKTFVHESCHMDQSVEKAPAWTNTIYNGVDVFDHVSLWIDGKVELSPYRLRKYTQLSLQVELDCERRAIKKLRKYKLGINLKEYIQKANSYVYFYLVVRFAKRFYTIGKEPYNIEAVWSEMPTHFNNNYRRLPARYRKLYEEHCFK